jgi:hypothetical protein
MLSTPREGKADAEPGCTAVDVGSGIDEVALRFDTGLG